MLRRIDEYKSGGASERFVARRVGDELKMDDRVAADAIRDVSTGREYSFRKYTSNHSWINQSPEWLRPIKRWKVV